MQLEKHHILALSLHGPDHQCNIAQIPAWQHKMIHRIMNIPHTQYSNMWREYRKRHNHKLCLDKRALDDQLKMQMAYLNNFNQLPRGSQILHIEKMCEVIHYFDPLVRIKLHGHVMNDWKNILKIYTVTFLNRLP